MSKYMEDLEDRLRSQQAEIERLEAELQAIDDCIECKRLDKENERLREELSTEKANVKAMLSKFDYRDDEIEWLRDVCPMHPDIDDVDPIKLDYPGGGPLLVKLTSLRSEIEQLREGRKTALTMYRGQLDVSEGLDDQIATLRAQLYAAHRLIDSIISNDPEMEDIKADYAKLLGEDS